MSTTENALELSFHSTEFKNQAFLITVFMII